jgi:UrcA family protein
MNRALASLLALLFASITVSSACLAEPDDRTSRQVAYGDLDLSAPAGVNVLDRRIELTANQVCLDMTGPSPAGVVDSTCKAEALRSAHQQIEHVLAQHHLSKSRLVADIAN